MAMAEHHNSKPSLLNNVCVKVLFSGVLVILLRSVYVVIIAGESCNIGGFCFFPLPIKNDFLYPAVGTGGSSLIGAANKAVKSNSVGSSSGDRYTSKEWIEQVIFYSSVFQDLISQGFLAPKFKCLVVESAMGMEVFALKKIGVKDSVGIFKKASKPLVVKGEGHQIPFANNTFDFIFSDGGCFSTSVRPADIGDEITRTLKPGGILVVHVRVKDTYSLNSFLDLFNSFVHLSYHSVEHGSMADLREFVLKREAGSIASHGIKEGNHKCLVPTHKRDLVQHAEVLIEEEPLKPWITLKRNIQNVKYIPSLVDISFKGRYVYIDVGARSYGSSIGSWFKKQYPKQNHTFDIYAIEADKIFHEEYKLKKGITLLPYAAWVRNETLSFEINRDPGKEVTDKGRGMGRIQPLESSSSSSSGSFNGEVDIIQGFDFADWLKNTVTERDFVVMKMDVEGTEFDLIPRLFETGAICLIDEVFLECHYNRWQRCCPGQRSTKYDKTYGQCLNLFNSLRDNGVLVHQWW